MVLLLALAWVVVAMRCTKPVVGNGDAIRIQIREEILRGDKSKLLDRLESMNARELRIVAQELKLNPHVSITLLRTHIAISLTIN